MTRDQNEMVHDIHDGTNDVDDQIVVKIVASMMRDDLDETKNVAFVKRSGFCGSSQTMILLMKKRMRNDFEVTKMSKTYTVDLKNDEVESYDCNVAASEIFYEISSSSDSLVL